MVDYGFRLPSAKDNRPLSFGEFDSKIDQVLFVSATPGEYEESHELLRAEQVIRPTGLLDPEVEVRPIEGQIDDLISTLFFFAVSLFTSLIKSSICPSIGRTSTSGS